MNNNTSRNRKVLKKRGSSVLSHVLASHRKEERRLEDNLIRQTVQEIEADDSWKHPISNNILGSMRIFNAFKIQYSDELEIGFCRRNQMTFLPCTNHTSMF